MRHTFKVYERLKREQHIHTLFLTGKAFSVFPVRVIYKLTDVVAGADLPHPPAPVQVGFSVPKKKFRSSVHRHRVRRLLFEAWRLHKATLTETIPQHKTLHVFLVFTGTELPQYEVVQKAVVSAIDKLKNIVTTPA